MTDMTRSYKVTVSKEKKILIRKSTHILTHMYFIKNPLQFTQWLHSSVKDVSESMSLSLIYLNVRNTYVVQYVFFHSQNK